MRNRAAERAAGQFVQASRYGLFQLTPTSPMFALTPSSIYYRQHYFHHYQQQQQQQQPSPQFYNNNYLPTWSRPMTAPSAALSWQQTSMYSRMATRTALPAHYVKSLMNHDTSIVHQVQKDELLKSLQTSLTIGKMQFI